ncbi:uncharacterized protein KGF55_000965 [Candida pseudojiufengensis]|uniref:uncharacterized protein n=1 Tax=Candida pseudojiufengensis TaxID=497109 RepID=UPI002225807C|nr:uncharacterized protein KGF55_000965 [Candida pseudojiufengensis]KAI5965603.1 hypothetical protein KGF55_000965 [Candida pseudojiufengensis]
MAYNSNYNNNRKRYNPKFNKNHRYKNNYHKETYLERERRIEINRRSKEDDYMTQGLIFAGNAELDDLIYVEKVGRLIKRAFQNYKLEHDKLSTYQMFDISSRFFIYDALRWNKEYFEDYIDMQYDRDFIDLSDDSSDEDDNDNGKIDDDKKSKKLAIIARKKEIEEKYKPKNYINAFLKEFKRDDFKCGILDKIIENIQTQNMKFTTYQSKFFEIYDLLGKDDITPEFDQMAIYYFKKNLNYNIPELFFFMRDKKSIEDIRDISIPF